MARPSRVRTVLAVLVLALSSIVVFTSTSAAALTGPVELDFNTAIHTSQVIDVVLTPDPGYEVEGGFGTGAVAPWLFYPQDCATDTTGAQCRASLWYQPTVVEDRADVLQVLEANPNNLDEQKSIYISVKGRSFLAAHADPDGAFGYVPLGSSYVKKITVTPDIGFSVAVVHQVTSPFYVQGDNCDPNAGGGCQVDLRFTPTSAGAASDTFDFLECSLPTVTPTGCYFIDVPLSGVGVAVTNGTLKATPKSVVAGDHVSVTSVTPCPAGSTSAILWIYDDNGASVANAKASNMDSSRNWAGTVVVPAGLIGPAFVTATCWNGFTLGTYAYVAITVNASPTSLAAVAAKRSNPVLSAVLTSGATPLPQQTVSFTARDALGRKLALCTATTNADGVASCTVKPAAVLLVSTYTATFAGTTYYLGSTGTAKLS